MPRNSAWDARLCQGKAGATPLPRTGLRRTEAVPAAIPLLAKPGGLSYIRPMHLITRTEELAEACAQLAKAPFVALDTEFMREQTFWPKLCLIQMAGEGTEVLVDSLAPSLDLKPFFDLMVNERVLKVFHSGRQDIEIVHHLAGVIPTRSSIPRSRPWSAASARR